MYSIHVTEKRRDCNRLYAVYHLLTLHLTIYLINGMEPYCPGRQPPMEMLVAFLLPPATPVFRFLTANIWSFSQKIFIRYYIKSLFTLLKTMQRSYHYSKNLQTEVLIMGHPVCRILHLHSFRTTKK